MASGGSKVGSKPKVIEGRPVLFSREDEVDFVPIVLVSKVVEVLVVVPLEAIEVDPEDAEDAAE